MLTFSLAIVSTSRTPATDEVAGKVSSYLETKGAKLETSLIVKDKQDEIQSALKKLAELTAPVIIFAGGTGLTSDDVTPEALTPMYERLLPGFDEAMRMANFAKVPQSILSRGVSGIYKKKIVLSLPGNPKAVIENLDVILSVLPHAVKKLSDDKAPCA